MQPLTVQSSVPDPFEAVVGFSLGSEPIRDLARCGAQYRRRAEMLAVTRRIMAAEGCDKVTIRSVSDACHVTAQTIHNSFGSKGELICSAMNQHTLMIDSFALSQAKDPGLFLMLAVAYCQTAIEHPKFMREYMMTSFSPKRNLSEALLKFGAELKTQILREMARRNLLRSYVDPRMAAEQIAYLNTFGLQAWAENDDIEQLHAKLVQGNGAILLGILEPQAARGVEDWLNDPANRRWMPAHRSDAMAVA
jgi:AcrR family transcriptional regulator